MITVDLEKGANSETIPEDEVLEIQRIDLEHTAISKYEVDVMPRESYRDYQLGTATVNVNGNPIISGEIQQTPKDVNSLTISGVGPVNKLKDGTDRATFQSTPVYEAIESYSNLTNADSWNVIPPFVRTKDVNETFVDAPSINPWSSILDIPDDVPVDIVSNTVRTGQTCWFREGENADTTNGTITANAVDAPGDYSNGEGERLDATGDFVRIEFTPTYDVPWADLFAPVRFAFDDFSGDVQAEINGNTIWTSDGLQNATDTPFWSAIAVSLMEDTGGGIDGGATHTMTVSTQNVTNGSIVVDVVAPYDSGDRFGGFNYNFDNSVDAQTATIDGPQKYPDGIGAEIDLNTQWHIRKSRTEITINDSGDGQAIRQSNDGGINWVTDTNTSLAVADFNSAGYYGDDARVELVLGRRTEDAITSPATGDSYQEISNAEISLWTDDLPIITQETEFNQDTWFANMQELHERGNMRFVADHRASGLEVESFRTGDPKAVKPSTWVVAGRDAVTYDRDTRDYANEVTVYPDPESNLSSVTLVDIDDQNRTGVTKPRPQTTNISDRDELLLEARRFLRESLQNDQFSGQIRIATQYVAPGYPYEPDEFDNNLSNMETVRLGYNTDENQSTLNFGSRKNLVASIQNLKND